MDQVVSELEFALEFASFEGAVVRVVTWALSVIVQCDGDSVVRSVDRDSLVDRSSAWRLLWYATVMCLCGVWLWDCVLVFDRVGCWCLLVCLSYDCVLVFGRGLQVCLWFK